MTAEGSWIYRGPSRSESPCTVGGGGLKHPPSSHLLSKPVPRATAAQMGAPFYNLLTGPVGTTCNLDAYPPPQFWKGSLASWGRGCTQTAREPLCLGQGRRGLGHPGCWPCSGLTSSFLLPGLGAEILAFVSRGRSGPRKCSLVFAHSRKGLWHQLWAPASSHLVLGRGPHRAPHGGCPYPVPGIATPVQPQWARAHLPELWPGSEPPRTC